MNKNIIKKPILITIMFALFFSFIRVDCYIIKNNINANGKFISGKTFINNNWYYFDMNGILQTGIYEHNNKKYYSTDSGIMVANQWITVDNKKYYVKADSSLAVGNIIINGKVESFDTSGEYKGPGKMTDSLFIKFLSVGNADCTYIKLPNGEKVLIDTGDFNNSAKVVSFLKEQDLKNDDGKPLIDYVILTHPHGDHMGGLITILDNFKVKKVYLPNIPETKDWYAGMDLTKETPYIIESLKKDYDMYKDIIDYINKNKINTATISKNQFIDENNILQFIQSDKEFEPKPIRGESLIDYWNDRSAIVYLNYGDLQALFTGDMEWRSEKDFVENKLLNGAKVDVIKVPHHGYDTSSTLDFIRYVKPVFGVISRSAENITADTSKNINENSAYSNLISNGVKIYETSEKDGVSIYATEENWNIEN
ncbi:MULTISPECIES: MBL fold metallo-hydrolase [unclassified Clostridium]|uniref:MBL fold metallo-hydrolase n=1 Tax=unclassified Clostridium TaxID=2614128 RepID=UPI00029823E8|nr:MULTISPECIES: MBL fold metallo-hydrolase [unclassified Clostridium]EKQ50899.1 MAG: putative hydrolase (metallo-beta-lactamase superfamily) [Clostridium sp. Maddingley MBC34-26]